MQLIAVLIPAEEGGFMALNPETGTSTQGESIEEALEEFSVASYGKPLLSSFEVDVHAAQPPAYFGLEGFTYTGKIGLHCRTING